MIMSDKWQRCSAVGGMLAVESDIYYMRIVFFLPSLGPHQDPAYVDPRYRRLALA
jgi:hypothetical protein